MPSQQDKKYHRETIWTADSYCMVLQSESARNHKGTVQLETTFIMFDMFLYYKKDKKKKQPTKKTGVDCWEVFDTHKSPPPQFFFKFKLHNLIPNILIPHC